MPLFFLDYIALGRMDPDKVERIVAGFARACAEFGCPLIGGETAEMPGTYAEDDYDLAGFIVGVVERDKALPRGVREGDVLLGLPSPGLHTNGYSLARKVLFETLGHRSSTRSSPELGTTVGAALLAPAPQLPGGPRAAPRARQDPGARPHHGRRLRRATSRACCPRGSGRALRRGSWEVPPLFRLIQKGGGVSDEEMFRTFNMGIGMVVVVSPADLHDVEHSLERRGETSFVIGSVVRGAGVSCE